VNKLKWDESKGVQHVMRIIDEILLAFQTIRIKKSVGKILGLSLMIWLSIFSVNYLLLKAFHIHLTYIEVVLVSTFMILLTAIPFQILSGMGIRETTWVLLVSSMGVPQGIAITAAFGTRIVVTLFLCLFGGYGLWKLQDPLRDRCPKE
jgi:uncharacterized protein (TIRG00374 family)